MLTTSQPTTADSYINRHHALDTCHFFLVISPVCTGMHERIDEYQRNAQKQTRRTYTDRLNVARESRAGAVSLPFAAIDLQWAIIFNG